MSFGKYLKTILAVYKGALKNLGWLLVLLAAAGAVSFIVVLPLWYAATRSRQVYTIIVLGGVAASVAAYLGVRIARGLKEKGTGFWAHLGGIAGKLGMMGFFILGLYGIIWLFSERLYAAAGASLTVYLVLLGVYQSWRSRRLKRDVNGTPISPS